MKIQFNPDLDYQREAIDAVVGIFEGQEICQTNFTVTAFQELADNTVGQSLCG